MSVPSSLLALIENFDRNIDAYRSGQYNETQVRRDYIDPFFKALGWDIDNSLGYAEAYRDVIHEDSIKIGATTHAPDYSFRVGGTRKFFLEAKKPSVNLKNDIEPAFQLRRYAWSAKLPLSILTDFEEFAVYDCRIKPDKADKASTSRLFYFTYKEYADRWEEISSIFSKDAVLKGSFDKYAINSKGKRGTTEVDDAFLEEIENWRELLAKNIALRNAGLSAKELNYSVQQTIDRIIFLRICEDRGIEPYGRLQALQRGTDIYARLQIMFRDADDRYNSGLFHFKRERDRNQGVDELTLRLIIDDKPLKDIFKNLYYPDCPYEFSVLGADILGSVYEQFLGKVIRLTPGNRAVVEDKPEVKKAGGVFYTPPHIVQYLLERTIGKLLENKSLKDAEEIYVIDPACGSGSFLIGAYQYFLDWHLDQYIQNSEKYSKGKTARILSAAKGSWRLTTSEKKRILLQHIYGVDIDVQAVEVSKLSLLLKMLEGESEQTINGQMKLFHERVLPDLEKNIQCGNSLVSSDFLEERLNLDNDIINRINFFDWDLVFPKVFKKGGFDAVIGNPPWGATFGKEDLIYLLKKHPIVPTKTKDSYLFFISKAIELAKKGGYIGFITPNTWLLINSAKSFREAFLAYAIDEIRDYGDGVFKKAIVESSTFVMRKDKDPEGKCRAIRLRRGVITTNQEVSKALWLNGDEYARILLESDHISDQFIKKLKTFSKPFKAECTIIFGIKPYQVGHGTPPQTEEILKSRLYHSDVSHGDEWKPLLLGTDVNRYQIDYPKNQYIKYGKWLMYTSNETQMVGPKILMRRTSDCLRCSFDENGYYAQNSLFIIYSPTVPLKLLLALLNSRLLGYVYKLRNPQKGKIFAEIKPTVVKELPIFDLTRADTKKSAKIEEIVLHVDRILSLKHRLSITKTPQDERTIQREIDALETRIDRSIYSLYELSEEEISMVEGRA